MHFLHLDIYYIYIYIYNIYLNVESAKKVGFVIVNMILWISKQQLKLTKYKTVPYGKSSIKYQGALQ